MSKNYSKGNYSCIKEIFSFSDDEITKFKEYSSKIYLQDEVKSPCERVNVDHVEVLNISLKSLSKVEAFQEKIDVFRNKLLNHTQFEETLTEIVISGLLAESNIPIISFEYEYRYDENSPNIKDLDICASIEENDVFFEIATRRSYINTTSPDIDKMHLINIQRKYEDKKIEEAYNLNFFEEKPIIFVVNSFRTLQHLFLNNAKPFLEKCKLIHSIILFSGYRIVNDTVKLSQGGIGYNHWCSDSIQKMIDKNTLTGMIKDYSVDASYDLELMRQSLEISD